MRHAASVVVTLLLLAGCSQHAAPPTTPTGSEPAAPIDAAPTSTSCAAATQACYDGPCSSEWATDNACNADMYEMYGGDCDDTNDALLACQRASCPGIPEPTNGYAATACPDWTPPD